MVNERGCEAIGIDLGTTYSSLAYMDPQLIPRAVPDSSGQTVVPSVVFFDDDEVIVGDIALQQSKVRSDRVVQFIKVQMGDEWRREIRGQVHTPESISAIILAHLVREASPQIGPISTAVITVPAYFTEKRRRATQHAGEIAGLTVIGTLNEPMAAALAYGLYEENREQVAVVYDLGGGTFDVTIVHISPSELRELVTFGNRQLGGKDWDQCLIDFVADQFQKRHGVDPRESAEAMQELQLECERAKRRLSRLTRTSIRLHAFDRDFTCEVTREQFESLTAHLLQTTKLTVEMAVEDAQLSWDRISRVVLVGGSTHMPMVRKMLKDLSGFQPDTGVNPVMAVSLGAATYAYMLETGRGPKAVETGEKEIHEVAVTGERDGSVSGAVPARKIPPPRFVTAHGLGVKALRAGRWSNIVLIPRNTPVPASASRRFYTSRRSGRRARSIKLEITQGDAENLDLVEVLGKARIRGLPENEPSGQPVEVDVSFDDQGRVHLHAVYLNTGQRLAMTLDVPGGLRKEEVESYRKLMEQTGLIAKSPTRDTQYDVKPMRRGDDDVPVLEPID